jgi:ribose-phosphate pyrophosphokinase
MKIFSGSANPELTEKIVRYLKIPMGRIEIGRFPDGETRVKILESVRGEDVFVVQPTCHPANENLMELLIVIDALRRASASRITAVLPFYGYARQDRKDQPRVPITAKLVANLLVAAGANRLLTMDLHAQQIQGFFDIPVDHLYSSPVITKYLKKLKLKSPVIVSPDTGGVRVAHVYSKILRCGLAIVAKQRKNPSETDVLTVVGNVKGCQAVIVDDLITTAGTVCSASQILKENGVKEIYVVATHAVVTPLGWQRLSEAPIKEIIVTDTVPVAPQKDVPLTVLSIASLLGEAIRRIHLNKTVSSLFEL